MRTLFVGALVATLVGCSCYVSPQTGFEACTSATGDWFACSSKTATSQRTEPEPTSFDVNPVKQGTKSKIAARTEKPPSVRSGDKSRPVIATAKPTATAIRVDSPEAVPARESSDPVLAQAKIKVAAKLEDPASAEFGEMKRAMRTNTLGQSVDTICGNVKGKKTSGEGAGDRPFLYLVKDDEAYVVDGLPTSPAATAYRNICNQVQ